MNLLGGLRQKYRGLPGGVAATDHDHFLASAELRFHVGGSVINAGTLKARQIGDLQFSILRPRSDDDHARPNGGAVVSFNSVGLAFATESSCGASDHHLGAEFLRLVIGASGEILAGDAGGKSQIVLDLGAGPCLAAGRSGL